MRRNAYSPTPQLKDLVYSFQPEDGAKFGGREGELKKIFSIISKRQYTRNVLIYGDFGIGKSSLLKKVVSTLSADDCPEKYRSFAFFELNVNTLISKSKQDFPSIFQEMTDLLTKQMENILIIDGLDILLSNEFIRNELIQLLKTPNTCIIATIDVQKYSSSQDEIFNLFEKINLEEPYVREVYNLIKHQIHELEAYHGIKISKDMANWIIHASIIFNMDCNEPRRSLGILDGVMTCARFNGHTRVCKSDFWDYFSLETKKFREMTYEQKLNISIHEIGHLVVYLSSEYLIDFVPVATSCIPHGKYSGLTHFDTAQQDIILRDSETFYIHLIAGLLGGKIAEEIFDLPPNAGASEDLNKANKMALDMATLYGMNSSTGDQVMLVSSLDEIDETISEETLLQSELFDDEVVELAKSYSDDILQRARGYAEEIITENKDLIAILAAKLAKEGILTKPDLDKIIEID